MNIPAFATLLLACTAYATAPVPAFQGSIERLDPALDTLLAPDAKIEVLASGFNWSEGPVWKDGGILFSDVPENTVFVWKEGLPEAAVFLKPSGCLHGAGGQGSNGLAVDANGRLVLCQHGERRVARLEQNGTFTPLADRFEGKRFNSPNDLVIARNGVVYFTDPPYGLNKDGPPAELDFHGIYSVDTSGRVSLIDKSIRFPNGIALSPDERTLYVAVSDPKDTRVISYDLTAPNPSAKLFFHAQHLRSPQRRGSCDGLKVDAMGNLWTTGPGGVLILDQHGKHLGSILTGQATSNCAWGGEDRSTLYITADMFLLRVTTMTQSPR